MKEFTEAETQAIDETRELKVSLDEKWKELSEYQTNHQVLIQQLLYQTFECW
jgi:hypothetical protein